MKEIYFVVPGKIVPKQSTRFSGHAFTPKRVKDYAEHVRECYREEYPNPVMVWEKDVPLAAKVIVYFQVPKSDSKKNRLWKLLHGFPTKVPDVDNCSKAVLDAVKGLIFYDDAQIVDLRVLKLWSENSAVEVTLREAVRE